MKIKELIAFLETIENKEQVVFVANYDFEQKAEIQDVVEIKSASAEYKYPVGLCLICEL